MRISALTTEAWRGLSAVGRPQIAYFYCLAIQAVAAMIWWPSVSVLTSERGPATLFAVLITLGVTLSYHSIRIGAEELLFPGQQSLREWLVSTRLPLWRILSGYFVGHIIQTLHWLLLSAPVLLLAWSVSGNDWRGVGFCLTAVFMLVSVYRIAGACVYLAIGQYKQVTWYSLRLIIVLGYIAGGTVITESSYWNLADEILSTSKASYQTTVLSAFALVYGLCVMVLGIILGLLALLVRLVHIRANRLSQR